MKIRYVLVIILAIMLPAAAERPYFHLQCTELNESSGVADLGALGLWSHNDSGDSPRFFVFGRDGEMLSEVNIPGIEAIDWEDMCAFKREGRQYVAVGDVGDNAQNRSSVAINVIEVPANLIEGNQKIQRLKVAARITLNYPEGALNCEALAYDPHKQVFLLASKEPLVCRLFEVDASPPLAGERHERAKPTATVLMPLVTGMDISPDGKRMALATYGPGCLIRRGPEGEWRTLGDDALRMFALPPRKQGESICFSRDGERLWLTSEFAPTPIYDIPLPE